MNLTLVSGLIHVVAETLVLRRVVQLLRVSLLYTRGAWPLSRLLLGLLWTLSKISLAGSHNLVGLR